MRGGYSDRGRRRPARRARADGVTGDAESRVASHKSLLFCLPVNGLEVDWFRVPPRDVLHNLLRVEPAILDEPAVGLEPATDGAGKVDPLPARLECGFVVHRRAI